MEAAVRLRATKTIEEVAAIGGVSFQSAARSFQGLRKAILHLSKSGVWKPLKGFEERKVGTLTLRQVVRMREAGASTEQIAQSAGVAPKTVYVAFSTAKKFGWHPIKKPPTP